MLKSCGAGAHEPAAGRGALPAGEAPRGGDNARGAGRAVGAGAARQPHACAGRRGSLKSKSSHLYQVQLCSIIPSWTATIVALDVLWEPPLPVSPMLALAGGGPPQLQWKCSYQSRCSVISQAVSHSLVAGQGPPLTAQRRPNTSQDCSAIVKQENALRNICRLHAFRCSIPQIRWRPCVGH